MVENGTRECLERAPGCKNTYIPKTFWQMTCENLGCKIKRRRRITKQWRERNPERNREYQKAYREH
jgi:hypothetical protein